MPDLRIFRQAWCQNTIAGTKQEYPTVDKAKMRALELTRQNKKEYHFTFNPVTGKTTSPIIEGSNVFVRPCEEFDNPKFIPFHTHVDNEAYECNPSVSDLFTHFIEVDRPFMQIGCPLHNEIITVYNPQFTPLTKKFIQTAMYAMYLKTPDATSQNKNGQSKRTMQQLRQLHTLSYIELEKQMHPLIHREKINKEKN